MDRSIWEMCVLDGATWGWRLDSDRKFEIHFDFYLAFVASLGIKWFDYACTVSDSYDGRYSI